MMCIGDVFLPFRRPRRSNNRQRKHQNGRVVDECACDGNTLFFGHPRVFTPRVRRFWCQNFSPEFLECYADTPACRAAFSPIFGGSGAVRAEGDVFRNGIAEQDDFTAARSRCCGANAKDPSVGCSRRPPEWRRNLAVFTCGPNNAAMVDLPEPVRPG